MTARKIWLIGGTGESAVLARSLAQSSLACLVSVTTEAARSLYPNDPLVQIWVGCLDAATIVPFLQTNQIQAILDASHPFAVEISQLAIVTATQQQIPYLRYERPSLAQAASDLTLADLLAGEELVGERVLLTIGYRLLPQFQPWHDRATLFARILPSIAALQGAIAAGFSPDRLIALRPPVSIDLERALWQQWQISLVVTKASGIPGGEAVKRRLAAELGVKLRVIDRPAIVYPAQTSDLAVALSFCHSALA